MSLLNVTTKYFYFENNGNIITVSKDESNHDVLTAISIAISKLNDINGRFN